MKRIRFIPRSGQDRPGRQAESLPDYASSDNRLTELERAQARIAELEREQARLNELVKTLTNPE